MDTSLVSLEVVELLSRISGQKLRPQDVTPLVVFLTALISILRGVIIIDKMVAVEEEERLQKTLKAFVNAERDRVQLIQRILKGVAKQQVYFNPGELVTLTALFSDSEKLLLMGFGYEMSAADGDFDIREQMYLQSIGKRLGIDPRHIAVLDCVFSKEGNVDPEAFAEVKTLLDPNEFEHHNSVFAKAAKHLSSLLDFK
ncbi:dynamin family protein [Oscillatoriales cyanobacterium USR001]|nr:dynamin family protein [Oscillatoriales cyanobacterium USR001]